MKISVFISSVQKELAEERRALKNFILGDPLLAEPLYRMKFVEKGVNGAMIPFSKGGRQRGETGQETSRKRLTCLI